MDNQTDRGPGAAEHFLAAYLEGRPDALIRLAHFVEPVAGVAIAERLLGAGWSDEPSAFCRLLGALSTNAPDRWPELAEKILSTVKDDQRAHGEIRGVFHELIKCVGAWALESTRAQLVEWFVPVAGPGDARLAIQLVMQGWSKTAENHAFLAEWCHPVAAWLVDKGPAELCREENTFALLLVINTCREAYPERLVGALRVAERSGKPDALFRYDGQGDRILHPAIEAALDRGLPDEWVDQVIGGAGHALGALGGKRFFRPLEPGTWMPRLRNALLGTLGRGRWTGGAGFVAWSAAFGVDPPPALTCTPAALESAFATLSHVQCDDALGARRIAAWVEVLSLAWFDNYELRRPVANVLSSAWPLDMLAAEPRFAQGVYRALQRALDAAPESVALAPARKLVAQAVDEPRFASVALLLLPGGAKAEQVPCLGLDAIREFLEAIVRHEWDRPVAGVDVGRLFRHARRVFITKPGELDPEVAVDFDGDTVRTGDSAVYMRIATVLQDTDAAVAVCALYFVHETIHVLQGVQRKSAIVALRSTASEFTLAQLDLEADDLTTRIVAAATRWPVSHLKDLTGRGVAAFPATTYHTNASVMRKSVRLLSLRIDHLLRGLERFGIAPEAPGYAFVEVPFGAGELLVMWSGEVSHRLITRIAVDAAELDRLVRAVQDHPGLAELDACLMELLAKAPSSET